MDEQTVIDVLSGRRRGIFPTALRVACGFASWGYAAGMALRNTAYDRRWLPSHRVSVPVISIGNITTGGTGKTPVVAWVTQRLQSLGYRPGILSRGYRSFNKSAKFPCATGSASALRISDNKEKTLAEPVAHRAANDEALVLQRLCPGVPQVAMRDRVAGAAIAIEQHGCDALVLDDAFQHRRLQRNLDLVLIDATRPWGFSHLLPRGLLREPLSALKRADVVIITRADQVDAATLIDIRHTITRVRGVDEHIAVRFAPKRLINAMGDVTALRSPVAPRQDRRLAVNADSSSVILSRSDRAMKESIAFCGIGNPDGFRHTLHDTGLNCELRIFPDHHHYTVADLDGLATWQQERDASALITTLKDLVKIPADHPIAANIWAVDIAVEFVAGEQHLERHLSAILPRGLIRAAA